MARGLAAGSDRRTFMKRAAGAVFAAGIGAKASARAERKEDLP